MADEQIRVATEKIADRLTAERDEVREALDMLEKGVRGSLSFSKHEDALCAAARAILAKQGKG